MLSTIQTVMSRVVRSHRGERSVDSKHETMTYEIIKSQLVNEQEVCHGNRMKTERIEMETLNSMLTIHVLLNLETM